MGSNFYAAGGWGMYPTSLFGFLLIAASVAYVLRPQQKVARLVLTLGIVTFAAGLLGAFVGICNSAHYLPQVEHASQIEVLALGRRLRCCGRARARRARDHARADLGAGGAAVRHVGDPGAEVGSR